MKKALIFVIALSIPLAIYLRVEYFDRQAKRKNSERQLGIYMLDVNKTDLGLYQKNASEYKNLTLEFKEDYTFNFSMKVPFIYDSIGTWEPAGSSIDEWNKLYYKNLTYPNGNFGEHVSRCCNSDTTIYINSTRPQKGQINIPKIVFKKLHVQSGDFKY